MYDNPANAGSKPQVSTLARRIHGWSWQAFPIGMGTGAVYVTLSGIVDRTPALTTVETVFYFLNMALFLLNSLTLLMQAIIYPRQAWRLMQDPVKGIFVPLVVLSFATIIIGTINYAVPTGHVSVSLIYALFWVYVVFSLITCFPMLMIWFNKPHDLSHFTPAYAFLIFPMMLVGVVAFNVLNIMTTEDTRAIGVLFTGYFFQGLGFFMTFFYICIYIIRIMTTGFLEGHQANGAFVAAGPPGFTALALINLGKNARRLLDAHNLITPQAGEIWFAVSVLSALMLYGLAVFLFIFGAIPWWFKVHKHLNEILGCWALTFPNVGWISTTKVLGEVLDIPGFFTIHAIFTTIMCITWAILFFLTILAFYKGLIFFSKEEDVIKDTLAIPEPSADDVEKARHSSLSSAGTSQYEHGHNHH
ncbi:malic acid transport protein mae1 [Moniliophthora roreri MCA 2997]|uniref:Malic acid transport protein mae1 n=2 Tax=Moniliophthora roreri TaxID=221103 RepID=V2WW76_MONRO|nr:malic acid transport protein mae1 [Moniliophthora roreri MCA 2997]KAI3620782.1 malic acid transport protein mae1 [Moniliophthora roreri]